MMSVYRLVCLKFNHKNLHCSIFSGDDVDHFAGSMIDHRVVPAHSMKTAETTETKQNAAPQYVNRTKKAPQALKDLYSFMKKPKSLIRATGSRVVPVKGIYEVEGKVE